jgi:arylsulfatase A-like enzyme
LLLHPEAAACGDAIINPAMFVDIEPEAVISRFGPFPERTLPRTALNAYFTRVITELVLPELAPDLIYFWHTDPDGTVHARGVGHPDSRQSIRDADANLGTILAAVAAGGMAAATDVIVISDHGFSTVRGRLDVAQTLVDAGLKESKASLDVVVTGEFVYVPGGGAADVEAVVRCLMAIDGIGAIFTGARGDPVPGTLPMSALGGVSDLSPDVMFSPAWDDGVNEHGVPGTVRGEVDGVAYHGSFSPWEVRNTLVASGPSFKRGHVSDFPAATIDLAPTLARILGVPPLEADGRVLSEALAGEDDDPEVERAVVEAACDGFRQEMRTAVVGGVTYVDSARRLA